MNPNFRRLASLVSAALLVVLSGAGKPASADDTEIFVAVPPPGTSTAANIMFIIDTSGSMDSAVLTQVAWDPGVTYSGSCDKNNVYWATGSNATAPSCSGRRATDNYVDKNEFLCQSAQPPLDSTGIVSISNVAQYRDRSRNRSVWQAVTSGSREVIDCKADAQSATADGRSTDDNRYPIESSTGNPYGTNNGARQDSWWSSAAGRNGSYTFYSGNYLNYLNGGGTISRTRLEIVQDVTVTTLDRLSNVNVGLTVYNNNQGGKVLIPMTPIETIRSTMQDTVKALTPDGFTPLSETLFEVYRYWAGLSPRYLNSDASTRVNGNGVFITPLGTESCAKNYNLLLTDGEPTSDIDANTVIPQLTGFVGTDLAHPTQCSNNSTGGENGRCLDDIAKYMYTHDLLSSTSVQDTVTTYTVGFGGDVVGSTTLAATAEAGGGTAYEASDTASLTNVFETIIREIISQDTSFTAPAVSVNAFNRTQNLSDLFVTVFQPSANMHWPGNLKKYKLKADGTIADSRDRPAVDTATGFFANNAQSFWSDAVDGSKVELGGAAHKLPSPADRNVYTDLAALTASKPANLYGVTNNGISSSNTLLIDTVLGLPSGSSGGTVSDMIQWVRGGNVDGGLPDETRYSIGDPLHARPVPVIYGGTVNSPDINDAVVYAATNDGYLHAIHPNGMSGVDAGEEIWTYIPSELLPRMAALRENDPSATKGFGLDGNVVAYKLDHNGDGIVNPANVTDGNDRVFLFFGMGRGGYNYYALDVTNKTQPKLLWRKGRNDILAGGGETWSTPIITRVNLSQISGVTQNSEKLVMIVGGGYDPSQDGVPYNVDDTGNRIYMIDAITGDLLWHAGPTNVTGLGYDSTANFTHAKLTHSIPADIRVIDLTNDDFADRMYAADTGGRVWRFDINNNATTKASLVTGGVFASLGNADSGSHPNASTRRFYNAPDASLLRIDGRPVINLALGSGFRAHPINEEIQDRFYSLRDKQPFQAFTQSTYDSLTPITDDVTGLIDVTGVETPTVASSALGWKMLLNLPSWQGEKVLTESRTFDGKILFSTFTPVASESARNACVVSGVKNTFYAISAVNGEILVQNELQQTGIAPTPVILFPPSDDPPPPTDDPPPCVGDACTPPPPPPTACIGLDCKPPGTCLVGLEKCPVDIFNVPVRTFWTQQNTDTN
ncbi:MAG: PilC/PilY family type IV pilus protein [Steroidobacteraceae bacterium]